MSGFEIAGVVLGTIPLIVEALNRYRQGIEAYQRWRRYKSDIKSLIRNLETEQLKLQNVCELLLNGLVPGHRMEEMIGDPAGPLWKDEELSGRIRLRLWKAGRIFEDTVEDMLEAVTEMRDKLGIDPDGKAKWIDQGTMKRELNRVSFVFQRSSYQGMLSRIRDDVSNLESLTKSNTDLEPERRRRSHNKLSCILREMAGSIFEAFRATFTCSCPRTHDVGLRLAAPSTTIVPGDSDEAVAEAVSFRFLVSYCGPAALAGEEESGSQSNGNGNGNGSRNGWRQWAEVRVRPSSKNASSTPCSTPITSQKRVQFSTSVQTSTPTSTLRSLGQTVVQQAISGLSLSTTCVPGATAPSRLGKKGLIKDFCEVIRNSAKALTGEYCGEISCLVTKRTLAYEVYLLGMVECGGSDWPLSSLGDILENSELPYDEKLHLALLVASGALHLQGTPWMPDSLEQGDFAVRRPDTTAGKGPKSDAYLLRNFPLPKAKAEVPPPSPSALLLSLGSILVRLMVGWSGMDGSVGSFEECLSDGNVARKMLDRVTMVAGEGYAGAVRRCIQRHGSVTDAFVDVVGFLEEDLRLARGL